SRVTRGNNNFVAVGLVGTIVTSSDEVMDTNSHVIGIETNEASLTINGNLTLNDNATVSSDDGTVSLGNLTLENGNIWVDGGTSSIAGGSVGADGLIKVGGQATLNLGGNLAVAGTFGLHPHANLDLAGNILDASGGRLEMGGDRSLDSITTNANTTLQVITYLNVSRINSATSTVGNLEMITLDGDTGRSLTVTDMSLTVAGTAQLDESYINLSNGNLNFQNSPTFNNTNINLNNGNLNFQNSPTFNNMSSLYVNNGEVILENGATISDSAFNLATSIFKPSGPVSLVGNGSLSLNETSSVILEGDTNLSQSGSVSWPSLDLNGKALTLDSSVTSMSINGALNIGTGDTLNSGTSDLSLSTLTIDNGVTLSSGSGDIQISGALTLNGELVQGGGILNLISGGTVGATGKLDVKDSELKLGSALSFAGTLVVNSGTTWSGL
ncbi:uncharacterized protein METZ01_LOCUS264022, partial [marine metagenome]